jgi:hypothetical protein
MMRGVVVVVGFGVGVGVGCSILCRIPPERSTKNTSE